MFVKSSVEWAWFKESDLMKTPKDWEIIAQKKDVEEIKKLLIYI